MEPQFWHDKWRKGEIGFHKAEAHPLLVAHFDALGLVAGARVFLPLCGMTRDIPWLLSRGVRVAGAELSAVAVEQVFEGLGVTPEVSQDGALVRYSAEGVDLFVGDIFDLSVEVLGPVDAVYDRAALVALPVEMRARYAAHVAQISGGVQQLLISFDYDQSEMNGPPFSVPENEVRNHYEASYGVSQLASVPVEGGLKGRCAAMEEVWLLGAV